MNRFELRLPPVQVGPRRPLGHGPVLGRAISTRSTPAACDCGWTHPSRDWTDHLCDVAVEMGRA